MALWAYAKERRARHWPAVQARVVETGPRSLFERTGRMCSINDDSDHFLEWMAEGRTFRIKLDDDASFAVAGLKLWRRPPASRTCELRYCPGDPFKHVMAESFGAWRILLGIALAAGSCALVTNAA